MLNPDRRGRGGLKIPIFAGRPKWMAPYEIQQNEIFIEIIYISNNENCDKLPTFTSKGLILLLLLIIAYNLILSESRQ